MARREFTLNVNKTKCVPFISYKNKLPLFKSIKINNTNLEIDVEEKVRYLGIYIDNHLKWKFHVEQLVKRTRNFFIYLKRLESFWTTNI